MRNLFFAATPLIISLTALGQTVPTTPPPVATTPAAPTRPIQIPNGPGAPNNPPVILNPAAVGQTFSRPYIGLPNGGLTTNGAGSFNTFTSPNSFTNPAPLFPPPPSGTIAPATNFGSAFTNFPGLARTNLLGGSTLITNGGLSVQPSPFNLAPAPGSPIGVGTPPQFQQSPVVTSPAPTYNLPPGAVVNPRGPAVNPLSPRPVAPTRPPGPGVAVPKR